MESAHILTPEGHGLLVAALALLESRNRLGPGTPDNHGIKWEGPSEILTNDR